MKIVIIKGGNCGSDKAEDPGTINYDSTRSVTCFIEPSSLSKDESSVRSQAENSLLFIDRD